MQQLPIDPGGTNEDFLKRTLTLTPEEDARLMDMVMSLGGAGVVDKATKAARRSAWAKVSLEGKKLQDIRERASGTFDWNMLQQARRYFDRYVSSNPERFEKYRQWHVDRGLAELQPPQQATAQVMDFASGKELIPATMKPQEVRMNNFDMLGSMKTIAQPKTVERWISRAGEEAGRVRPREEIRQMNRQLSTQYRPMLDEIIEFPTGKRLFKDK